MQQRGRASSSTRRRRRAAGAAPTRPRRRRSKRRPASSSPALHIAGNTAQPPVSMLPWTFALQTNSREAEKRIRQTRVLLRIFVCFDIFILIGGILNLVRITPTSENLLDMQHTFVYCTVAFFSLTLICNRLVIHLAVFILSQDRFCTVLQTSPPRTDTVQYGLI